MSVGSLHTPEEAPRRHAALGSRIGQYEIIRLLGRGGMGEVHLARDLRLGRLVAVKLLTAVNADLDERLLAEARATARCHHENIVVIHEVGAHRGQPYMVLEYLEGQTLRQWIHDHAATVEAPARVPPARAVDLMLPVVRALAYAHDQGVVHRDLKPENIMVTRSGAIKVLDFGIAKRVELAALDPASSSGDASVAASRQAGTAPYMSPEQLAVGAVDHRADVWAVGVMLFELVAGAHPLHGGQDPPLSQKAVADLTTPMPSARDRVPGLGPLAAIIDRCLIKSAAHRTSSHELLVELEALASSRRPSPATQDGSPFAGLAAFQELDAGRFFGRDRDIDHVIAELRGRPLVAVIGPSGAGKSSLIRAGVIPALKRSGEGWDAYIVRPGRAPLAALAAVLADLDSSGDHAAGAAIEDGPSLHALVEQLGAEPGTLGGRLRARATTKRRRIAVFVDQLEEVFTLGAPPAERAGFFACLVAVADDATSPLRVLVSMRSDFLDRLAEDRRLGTEVTRGLMLLSPMDRDGMREALVRPVEASEYRFEPPELVERMVDAVAATRGALPLLQFTATRLWERRDRDRRVMTEASYEALGGVAGALAMHADAVLAGMSAGQQTLARAVLERMITPERTRALVGVAELHALHRDPAAVDDLVQHLAAMRLVVIERDAGGADPTVELVHESLIDRWPALVRWLDDNQEDAAMLARLRAAARDWERGGHAAGLLWTGEVAREAGAWRLHYHRELPPVEQRYLAAVLAAAERARGLRRRLFGGSLAAAVLVAAAMAWLAWRQTEASRSASLEAARARDATRMAAVRTVTDDPTTQLALLREIEDVGTPPPGATQEIKRLLSADVASAVLNIGWWALSAEFSPDGRHILYAIWDPAVRVLRVDGGGEPLVLSAPDAVLAAAYSPDGRRIVVAADDRTVLVMNADGTGVPLILRGHEREVSAASFSPDGRRIASASKDRTVRVWNADGSGQPIVLSGHLDFVYTAVFSPDGQRIVSASKDRTVRVWSADGTGEPIVLRGHEDMVNTAVFSPDGQRIVSASDDRTVRVWRADGRGEPVILRGHEGPVQSAQFSPDGRRIASGSYDGTARLWNADGRGKPTVLRGHTNRVGAVAFSRDGRSLVSTSEDQTLRIWDVTRTPEPTVLHVADAKVFSAAFSPDGRRVVTASVDRTVQVWNADGTGEPIVLRGHDDDVYGATFSPDGQRIASASGDGTVRVWNADGRGEPLVLRGHDGVVWTAAFSPDGRRIVSASKDNTVRVWSADGRGEPLVLRGHTEPVRTAAFSPDGQHIVSSGFDAMVRVWRADGRGEPLVLIGHTEGAQSAAYSPDGRRIVSTSFDKTIRVWNADGSGEPLVLRGHGDRVLWAAFSPDGRRIVSSSSDRTIRVWRADGQGDPVVLLGHERGVEYVAFSPDGRSIVSASQDGTVRIWHDLAPVSVQDPRLWTTTRYCLPVDRRIKLLGMTQAQAARGLETCLARVAQATGSSSPR